MSTSYDVFTGAFLSKVTEYDFIQMSNTDRNDVVDGYMRRACYQFRNCKYDLQSRDDENRVFNVDIPDEDIDEITDIVSEGMLVQWMKPYYYKADNLENVLNTADFTAYSPAELLHRISESYMSAKKAFTNMCREYSYVHGALNELSI